MRIREWGYWNLWFCIWNACDHLKWLGYRLWECEYKKKHRFSKLRKLNIYEVRWIKQMGTEMKPSKTVIGLGWRGSFGN